MEKLLPTDSADFIIDESKNAVLIIRDLELEIIKVMKKHLKEDFNLTIFRNEIKKIIFKYKEKFLKELKDSDEIVKKITKLNFKKMYEKQKNN